MDKQSTDEQKRTIMVVDDSAENLRFMDQLLKIGGYSVQSAISGKLALQALGIRTPDLIFLDIHMPEMDGLEVCRRIRQMEPTSQIPVIFLSGSGEAELQEQIYTAGGSGWISKPFKINELLEKIKYYLDS